MSDVHDLAECVQELATLGRLSDENQRKLTAVLNPRELQDDDDEFKPEGAEDKPEKTTAVKKSTSGGNK